MRNILTDVRIKSLLPIQSQYDVSDSQIPGFGMRISPGGTKTFHLYYRLGKTKRRVTLGRYPDVPLKDARALARQALSRIAEGQDPQTEKQTKRQTHDQELFRKIVDGYIKTHVDRNTKPRSAAETKRILLNKFLPIWGRLHVSSIDKKMVLHAIDEILDRDGPSAANHAFSAVRHFFNWCVERDHLKHSPCAGLKKPATGSDRDRVLSEQELSAIWLASDAMDYPFGQFVQLLMLTAQRRSEVAAMRWSDIDLEKCVWTQKSNKSDRLHFIPLSKQAVALLRALPRTHDEFVFPAVATKAQSRASVNGKYD